MAVKFGLADFVTGGPILDLPIIRKSGSWSALLGRADALSCTVDLRDPATRALDLRSSSEPNKTIMIARTEEDVILAWGLIPDDGRTWDEDTGKLELSAVGIRSSYFGNTIIGPASALTAQLITLDPEGYPVVNPALDTTFSGWSHGTIGKKLVAQRLAWPGSPTVFDLPADQVGTRTQTYSFASLKRVGAALDDLSKQEDGPDFAFDAQRAPDGLTLRYVMRHGSEATPRIGTDAGVWGLGPATPISNLKAADAIAAGASAGWMAAGRQSGAALLSRVRNPAMLTAGYPALDIVDTTHSDVSVQATLDSYNAANLADAAEATIDLSFTVRADAHPRLGQYRPGDTITIDVPSGHPWFRGDIGIRITSISGDDAGRTVDIGCVVLDG